MLEANTSLHPPEVPVTGAAIGYRNDAVRAAVTAGRAITIDEEWA